MRSLLFCLLLTVPCKEIFGQIEWPELEGAGLVAYNQVVTSLGSMPVNVVYLRGDFRENGRAFLWPRLESEPGRYDFSTFLSLLDEAAEQGVRVGFRVITAHPFVPRLHPEYPFFPDWIPFKEVTRSEQTAVAPDWEDEDVQEAVRNLLNALGQAVGQHPALQFVDVGVLGWVGEWHTLVGFENGDFMPSLDVMKKYVDFHIEAFGAEKLLLPLVDMPVEVLAYGLARGINGIRQDCFGSTYHMQQYEFILQQVPALAKVIEMGQVFFEICGGNMSQWTHQADDPQGVTLTISEIMDRAIRWKCTLYSNVGAAVPERYNEEMLRLFEAMQGYLADKP